MAGTRISMNRSSVVLAGSQFRVSPSNLPPAGSQGKRSRVRIHILVSVRV